MLRVLILFILLLASPLYAQDVAQKFEVKTDLQFSENPPREDSAITYTVRIEWWGADDSSIKLIPPNIDTKGLAVENTAVSTESMPSEGGKLKQVRSFVFDLVPTKSGEVGIDAFPIEYIQEGRTATQQIEVPGRSFRVNRKPLNIPWIPIGIGAGLLGLIASITIFAIMIRKAKKEKAKLLDPNVQILEKLAALEPLLKKNEYQEYIARLVREFSLYLKKAHGLESTDLGIVEKHNAFSDDDKKLLTKIIEQLTELKYSTDALNYTDVKEIKRFVEQFIESKKAV
ncbi:MAG: hypothetical protein HZC17_06370 [Candidatus Omnitrophica bacterium]|nr:hypothetical protein [Candidatus Omnitrophota bacterium]